LDLTTRGHNSIVGALVDLRRVAFLVVVAAFSGCGDPCHRACRHVFEDCGLSTASSELACEQQCEEGSVGPATCAQPTALQDCYSAASCDALKTGAAAEQCEATCGS
jgi:hypothetical protein